MKLRYVAATPFFWLGYALSWPGFWLMALGTIIAERGDGRKLFH